MKRQITKLRGMLGGSLRRAGNEAPMERVTNLLDDLDLKYSIDEDNNIIRMNFSNEESEILEVQIIVRRSDLIFVSPYNHIIPDRSRGVVSDFVHSKNSLFAIGSLDYDKDEGTMWFRVTEFFGTRTVTREEVAFGIEICLETIGEVIPEIHRICGNMTPIPTDRMFT